MDIITTIKTAYNAGDESIYDIITTLTYEELDNIIRKLQNEDLAKNYELTQFLQGMLDYTK